jgi:hypothetical protein
MPRQDHRLRVRPAGTARLPASTPQPGPMTRAARVAPAVLVRVARVALTDTVRVGRAVLLPADPADPADLADLVTTARVDPAVLLPADPAVRADLDTQADPVGLVAPAVRVVPAAPGTATRSVATSTAPRGATGLALGVMAPRPARPGIGRCRRPVRHGTTARSTTTGTRRRPSGIPRSTSLASTSSESGFRCKPLGSRDARFASWRGGRRAQAGATIESPLHFSRETASDWRRSVKST